MNEFKDSLETMCKRCSNHEMCKGTGCSPKNKLQELVDKATPKKLIKTTLYENENHAVIVYKCPTCGEIYTSLLDKYCKECGQKFEEWI